MARVSVGRDARIPGKPGGFRIPVGERSQPRRSGTQEAEVSLEVGEHGVEMREARVLKDLGLPPPPAQVEHNRFAHLPYGGALDRMHKRQPDMDQRRVPVLVSVACFFGFEGHSIAAVVKALWLRGNTCVW